MTAALVFNGMSAYADVDGLSTTTLDGALGGFGNPPLRSGQVARSGDGVTLGNDWYGSREVTASVLCHARSEVEDWKAAMVRQSALLPLTFDADLVPGFGTGLRRIFCRPMDCDPTIDRTATVTGVYPVRMRWLAPDPVVYGEEDTDTALAAATPETLTNAGNFGAALWTFSTSADFTGSLVLSSDLAATAVITVPGLTMSGSDTLIIDAAARTIELNGVSVYGDCYGATAADPPEFFPLAPGDNDITSTRAGTFTWSSTWV